MQLCVHDDGIWSARTFGCAAGATLGVVWVALPMAPPFHNTFVCHGGVLDVVAWRGKRAEPVVCIVCDCEFEPPAVLRPNPRCTQLRAESQSQPNPDVWYLNQLVRKLWDNPDARRYLQVCSKGAVGKLIDARPVVSHLLCSG